MTYKAIFSMEGKKKNGEIPATLRLVSVNESNEITFLTWKEYKESTLKEAVSETTKKEFVTLLCKGVSFSDQIDLNLYCKATERSLVDKVDFLLGRGAKLTKRGLKV